MGKRESNYWSQPALRVVSLIVLSGVFLIGAIGGCIFAGLSDGEGAAELYTYFDVYLNQIQMQSITAPFWKILWAQGRYFLAAVLLGLTALGVLGFPLLFGIRGFLLAFSVASCYRVYGMVGLLLASVLFGLPAVLWLPGLFLLGGQGLAGSVLLLWRGLGDSGYPMPFCISYWRQMLLGACLWFVSALLEARVLPTILQLIAPMIG